VAAGVHDAGEVERAITAVAAQPNGGLAVYPHTVTEVHLRLIIELAGKYRLPAVYRFRYHAEAGGLLSYGVDSLDLVLRAADYVDRICAAPIPASYRSRHQLNLSLWSTSRLRRRWASPCHISLLARADEVIE
jgi:putative ABC transport system substrate-binding protein